MRSRRHGTTTCARCGLLFRLGETTDRTDFYCSVCHFMYHWEDFADQWIHTGKYDAKKLQSEEDHPSG